MIPSDSNLLIIGLGGNSLEVYQRVQNEHPTWSIGFLDDAADHPLVIGSLTILEEASESKKLFMIGSPKSFRIRQELFDSLGIPETQLFTFIDKHTWVSPSSSVAPGSVLMWNTYVGDSCKLGKNLLILPNVFVGHDTTIGDFTIIAANVAISGGVTIGKQCYIGANTTIREGITIGENSLIGAGSVVVKDIPSNTTFVGNPARDMYQSNR